MPGGYAHMTLVNLMRTLVDNDDAIPTNVKIASADYLNYVELGAVSPDYPYLDVLNRNAAPWADLMHYEKTGDMIKAGAKRVATMKGGHQTKCLAWLLGYAAHVTTDVTIHPIVELKVGPYAQNKTDHRICEMHQDAYIYQRLGLDQVGLSKHLKNNGISSCRHPEDAKRLDPAITDLWDAMLAEVHPDTYNTNKPIIDSWHSHFIGVVNTIEESHVLPAIARHVAVNVAGMTYPSPSEIKKPEFIDALQTPEGPMHYDAIFDRARTNVARVWGWIGHDVADQKIDRLALVGAWNLDTGRDIDTGELIFWTA